MKPASIPTSGQALVERLVIGIEACGGGDHLARALLLAAHLSPAAIPSTWDGFEGLVLAARMVEVIADQGHMRLDPAESAAVFAGVDFAALPRAVGGGRRSVANGATAVLTLRRYAAMRAGNHAVGMEPLRGPLVRTGLLRVLAEARRAGAAPRIGARKR